jgi:methyl-accepting chemotaxis protein
MKNEWIKNLSHSNQTIVNVTNKQAVKAEELAASISDIISSIQQNSDNVIKQKKLVTKLKFYSPI